MRKLPPLASLRAFEAAARRLSFERAAVELGVTPTAISHQIRILEEFCGQALFRRRPGLLRSRPQASAYFQSCVTAWMPLPSQLHRPSETPSGSRCG